MIKLTITNITECNTKRYADYEFMITTSMDCKSRGVLKGFDRELGWKELLKTCFEQAMSEELLKKFDNNY